MRKLTTGAEDDPAEIEPFRREMVYGWGQEATPTMKFFHFTRLPKAEEYTFAPCLLLAGRNSKTIPQSLGTDHSR